VPVASAGALLAEFHQVSLLVSPADQRPLALPMHACRPSSAGAIAEQFHAALAELGHASARHCVVHGDCTAANMLVDGARAVGMIDFELAHLGPPESDISFALWVTGRAARLEITLDAERVRAFVQGYHRVRPLTDWAIRAIPLYLVGRGLQMHVRLERAGVHDQVQLTRLRWLHEHRPLLEQWVSDALGR
jgi:Ser/Thr protein kinase RdoA (MazF antagonist)